MTTLQKTLIKKSELWHRPSRTLQKAYARCANGFLARWVEHHVHTEGMNGREMCPADYTVHCFWCAWQALGSAGQSMHLEVDVHPLLCSADAAETVVVLSAALVCVR